MTEKPDFIPRQKSIAESLRKKHGIDADADTTHAAAQLSGGDPDERCFIADE